MPISVVTTRESATAEMMIAATRKLKAAAQKHGAEHLSLNQVVADPDFGLWFIRFMCADWEVFGKLMQAASSDSAARDALAGLDAVSKVISRRVLASVDL